MDERDTRFERGLAIAGVTVVVVVFTIQVVLEQRHGGSSTGSLIVGGLIAGFAFRSWLRWRRRSGEWPTFAWFCALLYGTYFALLFGGAMVGVIDSTDAVGSTMAICFGLGIVAGIVGVILLKRAAQNRANEAYLEWKRNTTMPPPPPQQPAP